MLEERHPKDSSPGAFGLIGGRAEHGERGAASLDTIRREVEEETGLDPDTFDMKYQRTFFIPSDATGRDNLIYHVYSGTVPVWPLELPDAAGAVRLDPEDVLQSGRLTKVATFVLQKMLQETRV